uniref:5'-nucleotidase n=1 Tax=Lygus hesperus TaxID=30085 RepID=A0A0A9YU79_LYGHE
MTTRIVISELEASSVRMKNKDEVYAKIQKIIDGRKDKLQIITDFDRTVSKHHHNGKTTPSSYAVFELAPSLPKSFIDEANAIYSRFRVYEEDPKMSIEEKIPYMVEWWKLNEKLFTGLPYSESEIDIAVNKADVQLRVGSDDAFRKLHDSHVPTLVFSAGLGPVVSSILRHYDILYDNVHVISNFFEVENGTITGFNNGTILHIYNKNQHAIENSDYFKELSHRPNVILMGDSIGDANMNEGVQGAGEVLKIGFLSIHIDDYLPQYLDKFDIVLLDDQTMDVFNALLDRIL